MQDSLVNLFKRLISNNFLIFVDVNNFLQNTCSLDILENREMFLRLYKSDITGKRGYVWIDCQHFKTAFEMLHKHDCFIYKIKMQSFNENCYSENCVAVLNAALKTGFTAFSEDNVTVFPINSGHLNDTTKLEYLEFCKKQPVICDVCGKAVKNERGLKRHINLYHALLSKVKEPEEI